jgi:urease accessory protein
MNGISMTASAKFVAPENAQEIGAPSRVHALLRMNFSQDPQSGLTFLSESYQEPPLKVVRAFSLPDGAALAHLHNVSGGLLGGDRLTLQMQLAGKANVQLTTTGATRIYRHREDGLAATQDTQITVGEDALLEYLPDATIPFAGARYHQQNSIQLAAGAGLFWWEILAPGREARGECFGYDELRVRTRITAVGRMIAAENLSLQPGLQRVSSLARLGEYRYVASFYICRVGLDAKFWRAAEEHLRELTSGMTRSGESLWGVSSLAAHGLLVRCLACHGRQVLPGLQAVWRKAKFHFYGQEAIPPRKVN